MTAYKKQHLNSKLVRETAQEAFYEGLIDKQVYSAILQKHSYQLYTPNVFIFSGFALLTLVVSACSTALLGLVLGGNLFDSLITLCVTMAVFCYVALELLVNTKKHFNAGIDNMLMAVIVLLVVAAFALSSVSSIAASGVLFIFCAWLCYRFTDAFMGTLAYVFIMAGIFYVCIQMGSNAIVIAPFILAVVSAITYFGMNVLNRQAVSLYHRKCISYIKAVSVAGFYASLNYFVVNSLANSTFYQDTQLRKHLPAGWVLWVCTAIIPVIYLLYGIRTKSLLFVRSGVLFIALSILTVHYYYPFMPAGVALMLAGAVVIPATSFLMHWLRKHKHGFVFEKDNNNRKEIENIEAVILAEAFKVKLVQVPDNGVKFGGGSSGGGGATGDY